MSTPPSPATRSSDGRFEICVEEIWDRASPDYTTHLRELATGATLFSCQGSPSVEFREDGTCVVQYFGYQPHGVVIHLGRREFRLHESDPWLPLSAWAAVEAAYGRGWSSSWAYRSEEIASGSGWVEGGLGLFSLVITLVLLRYPLSLAAGPRIGVCVVAAVASLFFGWLWLAGVRHRQRVLALRNPRREPR